MTGLQLFSVTAVLRVTWVLCCALLCCIVLSLQLQHLADLLPVKKSDDEFVLQVSYLASKAVCFS